MSKSYIVGLMSGTSLDGIDAALIEIEGINQNTSVQLIKHIERSFTKDQQSRILDVLSLSTSNVKKVCDLNVELGHLFAQAVQQVCDEANLPLRQVELIASHGLTVYHNVIDYPHSTLQLGDPAIIAYETNTTVVSNFRSMDIAAGGQGAPLVPFSETILYRHISRELLLLNIGGIANLTKITDNHDDIVAFDTGPGNMIIDEWMRVLYQQPYDKSGTIARSGSIHQPLLEDLREHPFLQQGIPKSTGREQFGQTFAHQMLEKYKTVAKEDLITTVTMFTALSIVDAIHRLVEPLGLPPIMIVSGGGAKNTFIIEQLSKYLSHMKVATQESYGFSSQAKEAIAFAILGHQTIHGEPSNVPQATGAQEAVVLGNITPAPRKAHHEL